MKDDFAFSLQLFAEDGEGCAGEEISGVNTAADAGQQKLLDLGVPRDVIEKRASRDSVPAGQAAAAENTQEPVKTNRMTWAEIMADPEYNRQMQSVVQSRLKTAKAAEENLSKLAPALLSFAKQHGLSTETLDYDALSAALSGENPAAEQPQPESAPPDAHRQLFLRHMERLQLEGERLKQIFPQFDLRRELRHPTFRRMTAPQVGLSVEDAYYAVHRKEIQSAMMRATARQAEQKLSNAIRSGQQRPVENGTSGQATSVLTFDYRSASREQREALKQRILQAHARGEKIYPGG